MKCPYRKEASQYDQYLYDDDYLCVGGKNDGFACEYGYVTHYMCDWIKNKLKEEEKMEEKYYMIYSSEDGEVSIHAFTKKQLLTYLNDEINDGSSLKFMSELEEGDPGYWGKDGIIIKGKIVTPFERKIVTTLDI